MIPDGMANRRMRKNRIDSTLPGNRLQNSIVGGQSSSATTDAVRQKIDEWLANYDPIMPDLDLSGLHIEAAALSGVLSELKGLAKLSKLKLGCNKFGDEGARVLARSELLNILSSLDISDTGIGPKGAQVLAASKHCSSLWALDVGYNQIGDEGTGALAASMHLSNLRVLALTRNRIRRKGATALARSRNLPNLRFLDISFNLLGDGGAKALAKVTDFPAINCLYIGDNRIGPEGAKALAESKHLSNLTSLGIADNKLGAKGAKALAVSEHLSALESLNIAGNAIGDEGATSLAASAHLLRLHRLFIGRNEISDPQVIVDLCERLLNNRKRRDYEAVGLGPEIAAHLNPLRWKGPGGNITETTLATTDPTQLRERLEEVRNEKDREQVFIGRIIMSGPTEHGKSHLAQWLTVTSDEQKRQLMRRQDRGHDGDGTWGAECLQMTLSATEHKQPALRDVQLRVLDCGGHPQQLQSHQNLYLSSWSRSVFILCVRADRDFVESLGEYHLGLIADLKMMNVANRHFMTPEEVRRDLLRPGPPDDPERMKLCVVIVATHADQARVNGRKFFPNRNKLAQNHTFVEVRIVDAWDALEGKDIDEVKRAIGEQLTRLPELRASLAKYILAVGGVIEKEFAPDGGAKGAPVRRSMPYAEFKTFCDTLEVQDEENRHLYVLRVLDILGYVVAPRCHEETPPDNLVVLNPNFVQDYFYQRLLNRRPRPSGGILTPKDYALLTRDLNEADRASLESLIKACLVSFEVRGEGGQPRGWLIPDLLEPMLDWPKWSDVLWSAHIHVPGFLNESRFFEFVRDEQESIERTADGDVTRLTLYRNGCVLQDDQARAMIRIDVRKRTIDIEVRGGRKEAAKNWCQILLSRFEKATGVKGTTKPGAGNRGPGKPVDYDKKKLIRLWEDWACTRESSKDTKRTFAKRLVQECLSKDKYGLRIAHGDRLLIEDVINAIDYGGRLSRGAE
jgi:Ran GTPase-activating protein (RanGAP) involved in mRNA processing and transport